VGAPSSIAAGPDGNLWFTATGLGRISPTGTITMLPGLNALALLSGITAGPDGNMWFTESGLGRIGRIKP